MRCALGLNTRPVGPMSCALCVTSAGLRRHDNKSETKMLHYFHSHHVPPFQKFKRLGLTRLSYIAGFVKERRLALALNTLLLAAL